MGKVLFTSRRPLGRCENITTLYHAYDGEKDFVQENWKGRLSSVFFQGDFTTMVSDEFVSFSPGVLIMVEHGISGGKTYGLDQPHGYHKARYADLIDFAVCTSKDTIELTAKNRGIPKERVLPLGMPRTDVYFGKHKGDGGTFLAGKRAYLFAPTFRKKDEPQMPYIDWKKIDNLLTDNEILVVKPHMVTGAIDLGNYKYNHIVQALSTLPSTPFLIDCDVLITDYSTILFDAHILKKPVVLFEKEQGFVQQRGMYFEYPYGYSSRYCTKEEQLVQMCREAQFQNEQDLECLKRACGACDGHSTERVIRLIKACEEEQKWLRNGFRQRVLEWGYD